MSKIASVEADHVLDSFYLIAYARNRQSENLIIKSSRLELQLRNTMGTVRLQQWLPGWYGNDAYYCSGGQWKIQWGWGGTLGSAMVQFADTYQPLDLQPESVPLLFKVRDGGCSNVLYNGTPMFSTPFPLLRLYSIAHSIPNTRVELLRRLDRPKCSLDERLEAYDRISLSFLSPIFGVKDQLIDDSDGDAGQWQRAHIDLGGVYDSKAELIWCCHPDGVPAGFLEWVSFENQSMLLPVRFYCHGGLNQMIRLYIPPRPPLPLLNADLVVKNSEAMVILTDELAIASTNRSDGQRVFCSFYGGDEAIQHLDITMLAGRHVIWLLLDRPDVVDPLAKYKTAVSVAKKLHGHGCTLEFAEFIGLEWYRPSGSVSLLNGKKQDVKIITQEELITIAAQKGIYIPSSLRVIDIGNIEGDVLETMETPPLLIDPILREESSMVIYGGTGVAKSWLAMSIAAAAASGVPVFPDHWRVTSSDGIKCLVVAGEMHEGEYGKRLKRLNRYYTKDQAHKKNFILQRTLLDLTAEDGAKRLHDIIDDAERNCGIHGQPVKLVILDNLATLSTGGENSASFGRIEYVLRALKARGIAVILIHHENKQGDIRGAQKISDVMDTTLHLLAADVEGDQIGLVIENEKIRAGRRSEFATFKVVLDVDAPDADWVVMSPSPRELARIGESAKPRLKRKSSKRCSGIRGSGNKR